MKKVQAKTAKEMGVDDTKRKSMWSSLTSSKKNKKSEALKDFKRQQELKKKKDHCAL